MCIYIYTYIHIYIYMYVYIHIHIYIYIYICIGPIRRRRSRAARSLELIDLRGTSPYLMSIHQVGKLLWSQTSQIPRIGRASELPMRQSSTPHFLVFEASTPSSGSRRSHGSNPA